MSRAELVFANAVISRSEIAAKFREEILEGFDRNTLSAMIRKLYRRGILLDWEKEYLYEKLGLS